MSILEYEIKKASLEAEIQVAAFYFKQENNTEAAHKLIGILHAKEQELDNLIESQIPF